MPTVLHVSPHPDDETIGAPCALLALQRSGWRVINLAVGLGRPSDHDRRRDELERAIKVAGFVHRLHTPPLPISRGDDHTAARHAVTAWVGDTLRETGAELVVGPHPQDGHHGHVTVARGIGDAVRAAADPPVWWMWSIWAELPHPTLLVPCTEEDLQRSADMLEECSGENARNDYRVMHRPLREVNAVRGPERIFGFGSTALDDVRYAELLAEMAWRNRRWFRGRARVLDPEEPTLGTAWRPVGEWFLGDRPRGSVNAEQLRTAVQ